MLAECGFRHSSWRCVTPVLPSLILRPCSVPIERAGARLLGVNGLERPAFAAEAALARSPRTISARRPDRCGRLLFDKPETSNRSIGWHQDRTIAVVDRCDVEGFGPWTIKAGMVHVEPPPGLQATMITLRVHSRCRGSHQRTTDGGSRVRIGWAASCKRTSPASYSIAGTARCIAEAGDIWAYSTLIVHASEVAAKPRRRRVLQVDYAIGAFRLTFSGLALNPRSLGSSMIAHD